MMELRRGSGGGGRSSGGRSSGGRSHGGRSTGGRTTTRRTYAKPAMEKMDWRTVEQCRRYVNGGGWEYQRPIYEGEEIRMRDPKDPENRDKRIEGGHLDNDDIKDIAEDMENVMEDFDHIFDDDKLMKEWLRKTRKLLKTNTSRTCSSTSKMTPVFTPGNNFTRQSE